MQATPDNRFSTQDLQVVGLQQRKHYLFGVCANTKASIADAMLDFAADTGADPPCLLLNTYVTLMIQNTSDVILKFTEFRYTSRIDNSDTVENDANNFASNTGYSQYGAVPTGYYNWNEAADPYSNAEFWRLHKPFKPRVRICRPGKVVCFNTYSKQFFDYSDLQKVGDPSIPDTGMIKGKTVRCGIICQAQNTGLCTTDSTHVTPVQHILTPQFTFTLRGVARVKSRAIDIQYPDIFGSNNTEVAVDNDNAHPLVPAGGHELHFARSANEQDSGYYHNAARQVWINHPHPCEAVNEAPLVEAGIIGQPIDVNVVP